jgi:hypothetical protein
VIPQLRYRMMPGRGWTWTSTDHYVVISGLVGDDFIIDDPIPDGGKGERLISAGDSTEPGGAATTRTPDSRSPGRNRACAGPCAEGGSLSVRLVVLPQRIHSLPLPSLALPMPVYRGRLLDARRLPAWGWWAAAATRDPRLGRCISIRP